MKTFFAINKHNKTACLLPFSFWEEVQSAFRFGIVMPDGGNATGIGRCEDREDYDYKCTHGGWHQIG